MKKCVLPFNYHDIRLRLIEEDDLPMTLAWRNRDEVRKWFKYSEVLSLGSHREWFQKYLLRDNDYLFIVEEAQSAVAVGQASVYDINWEKGIGEVGRFIAAPEYRGRGYMKQACAAIAELSFRILKIQQVFLEVFPDNERAMHVYTASGYSDCGIVEGMRRMLKEAGTQS